MAEQTINYGLVKPAPDEFYDVSVSNGNMEIIDSKMKELETNKADAQGLKTLSNTVSNIMDDTAIKEVTLNAGEHLVESAIKSPVNVLRIDGKTIVNHAPLFDSGTWVYQSGIEQNVPLTLLPNDAVFNINKTLTANLIYAASIKLKPNTQYTLSMADTGFGSVNTPTNTYAYVDVYASDNSLDTPNADGSINKSVTFTTTAHTEYFIRLVVMKDVPINNIFTFRNVSLVEGSQALPFVANVKPLTNPTIANETNGTSMVVPTTLYDGEYVEQNTKVNWSNIGSTARCCWTTSSRIPTT